MDDELAEIDSLLASIPTVVCPKCGNRDATNMGYQVRAWSVHKITEVNPVNRGIYYNPISYDQEPERQLHCFGCNHFFDIPKGWSVGYRNQPKFNSPNEISS